MRSKGVPLLQEQVVTVGGVSLPASMGEGLSGQEALYLSQLCLCGTSISAPGTGATLAMF